ncbi:sulfate reduction electron transfer complex DsrMKJOP subunit DsrO [Chloroflexota bacterium]
MTAKKFNRRDFLKISAVGVGAVAGLKMMSKVEASSSVEGAHQWAMVIDQSKCEGCGYCTLACRAHNDVSPDISWNQIIRSGNVDGKDTYITRPCMHCEKAPCVDVCMVGASYYRPDGIVMMDYDKCIGCRYCEAACPYDARSFNWEAFTGPNPAVPDWGMPEVPRRERGVVEKCSFCFQRIDRGLKLGLTPGVDEPATPACVVSCPGGSRIFGDLKDPESVVSKLIKERVSYQLRVDLGTSPRVYYLPANSTGA